MFWQNNLLLFILLLPQLLGAADKPVAAAKAEPQTIEKSAAKPKKRHKPVEKLDLNQVDLEKIEEDWQSTNGKGNPEVNGSIKIREIVEPSADYSYASFGRPDPFLPPEIDTGSIINKTFMPLPMGKEIRMVSVLQEYPLSDLNIKGVWQLATGEIRAVVLTPKNEGVVVKEGDPISSGKVLNIRRDQLTARLYRLRADGVREYEDVAIKIGGSNKDDRGVIKLEPGKDPVFVNPAADRAKPVPLTRALAVPPVAPPLGNAPTIPAAGVGQVPALGKIPVKDLRPGNIDPGQIPAINPGDLPIKIQIDGAAQPLR